MIVFFISALKACKIYTTNSYDYTEFIPVNNISFTNPEDDFYLNFKIFAVAKRDVHILLSQNETDTRSSYEIVVGSLKNSQIEIRRHTDITNNLFKLRVQNILQMEQPNEIHIKISKSKYK